MEQQPQQPREGWPQWIAWWTAGFAILSNVIGVAEVATDNRFVLSLAAGTLAVGIGAFSLWRLFARGKRDRAGVAIFAVNLAMVVVGAGVLGGAVVTELTPPPPDPGLAVTSGQNRSAPTGQTQATTGPVLEFLYPRFGNTFTDGLSANGKVTGMPAGAEVWMLVRPQDSGPFTAQGPCKTDAAMWICPNVRLTGPDGFYVLMVVLAPPETAALLRDVRELAAIPAEVLASTEIVVQG